MLRKWAHDLQCTPIVGEARSTAVLLAGEQPFVSFPTDVSEHYPLVRGRQRCRHALLLSGGRRLFDCHVPPLASLPAAAALAHGPLLTAYHLPVRIAGRDLLRQVERRAAMLTSAGTRTSREEAAMETVRRPAAFAR